MTPCPGCSKQYPLCRCSAPGGCSIPPQHPPGRCLTLGPWVPVGAPLAPATAWGEPLQPPSCMGRAPGSPAYTRDWEAPRGRQGDPGWQRMEGHGMEGARVQGGEEEVNGAEPWRWRRTQLLMGLLQPSQCAPDFPVCSDGAKGQCAAVLSRGCCGGTSSSPGAWPCDLPGANPSHPASSLDLSSGA